MNETSHNINTPFCNNKQIMICNKGKEGTGRDWKGLEDEGKRKRGDSRIPYFLQSPSYC